MANTNETARATVILNGQQANATLKEIEAAARALNSELKNCKTGTQEFADKASKLQELNTKLGEIRKSTKAIGDQMKESAGGITSLVKEMGAGLAAAFGIEKIGEYFKEGIKKAIELRDTEKILLEVLDGNKAKQRELIDLAKERAGVSMDSRLEIEQAEKFLAIQDRTPDQIKKTIEAAQDLAVVTGQTLEKAVEDLDATMEGRIPKGLQKLSSGFKDLTKEQLYSGAAIDLVAKKYKGLAEGEMQTTEGHLNLLSKAWNALQRTMGEAILGTNGIFDNLVQGATDALNSFKKLFEIPMAEKYRQEEESLNALVFQIQATNTNQQERNRLIEELRQKYPEFLGNIKDEDVSNQYLAKHLEEVNYQYMEKIRLAESEDKLKDIAELQAKASKKLSDAEMDRNKILASSMDLLYKSNAPAAKLVEQASSLEEKIRLVKEYWGAGGGSFGTASAFLEAAEKARQAADKMKVYGVEFKNEQLKIAEEAVNSSLNLTNTLDNVSDQILSIAVQTRDENLKSIVQSEMEDRERRRRVGESEKVSFKEDLDWKKMSVDQLNDYISKGREADATNSDRTNMRKAQDELNSRTKSNEKLKNAYQDLIDAMKDIDNKNFATKLTNMQREINAVEKAYDTQIQKALKFKKDNEKALAPEEKKGIDDQVDLLRITKEAQIQQVLKQQEQQFATDVAGISDKLRIARLSIAQKQVEEIKQKYKDAKDEILSAILYAYNQEVAAAEGNNDKLILAEQHRLDAIHRINKDIAILDRAEQDELKQQKMLFEEKFVDDLEKLREKGERDIAVKKEKIELEVQAKYKKILADNIGDEAKTNTIKEQMAKETADKIAEYNKKAYVKLAGEIVTLGGQAVSALSQLNQIQTDKENADLQKDEDSNNKKKKNLEDQLSHKLISQKQYDDAIKAMDDELDAKKKKLAHDQAVRNKQLALAQGIINVAQAVTSALTGGPILGEVLAIITAALGAAQIAIISSTEVPQASKGRYSVIGAQDGKTYDNVPYEKNPQTGIYSSPLLISETGKEMVIDPVTTQKLVTYYPQVIQAINYARTPQAASGRYFESSSNTGKFGFTDPELIAAITKLNEHLDKGIPSYISYTHLQDELKKVGSIESDVSNQ